MNIISMVLWVALAVSVLGLLFSGLHRTATTVEGLPVNRWSYRRTAALRAAAVGVAGFLLLSSIAIVPYGHRGVVFSMLGGVQDAERYEGLSLVVPLLQQVYTMNVQTQVYSYEAVTQTADLQEVKIPVSVQYHIDPDRAAEVYQDVGKFGIVAAVVLEPPTFLGLNSAVGKILAVDLAQQTPVVAESVVAQILPVAERHAVVVEFVSINDKVFDPEFIAAVKAKVIEGQKKEQSEIAISVAANQAQAAIKTAE